MDADSIECPICNRYYGAKIFQCESGHCLCQKCSRKITVCPTCNAPMKNSRNTDMEKLVDKIKLEIKLKCENVGCTYKLKYDQLDEHLDDCKYRQHYCHGALFCGWSCNWSGNYDDLLRHYKTQHERHSSMQAVTKQACILYKEFNNYSDTQIVSFLDGKQLFYFKHRIDAGAAKAYWIFQFVGPVREARNYLYEFEINLPPKKFKVTDVCASDTENCDDLMEREECICLSLAQLKNYLDEEKTLTFCFRILNARKTDDKVKPPPSPKK